MNRMFKVTLWNALEMTTMWLESVEGHLMGFLASTGSNAAICTMVCINFLRQEPFEPSRKREVQLALVFTLYFWQ